MSIDGTTVETSNGDFGGLELVSSTDDVDELFDLYPSSLRVSQGSNHVYVFSTVASSVSVLRTASGVFDRVGQLSDETYLDSPVDAVVSSNNKWLFVASRRFVSAISIATKKSPTIKSTVFCQDMANPVRVMLAFEEQFVVVVDKNNLVVVVNITDPENLVLATTYEFPSSTNTGCCTLLDAALLNNDDDNSNKETLVVLDNSNLLTLQIAISDCEPATTLPQAFTATAPAVQLTSTQTMTTVARTTATMAMTTAATTATTMMTTMTTTPDYGIIAYTVGPTCVVLIVIVAVILATRGCCRSDGGNRPDTSRHGLVFPPLAAVDIPNAVAVPAADDALPAPFASYECKSKLRFGKQDV